MQKPAASRFSALFNPRLVETRTNGTFEEQIYKSFGFKLRYRRRLSEPEKGDHSAPEPAAAVQSTQGQSAETIPATAVQARQSTMAPSSPVTILEESDVPENTVPKEISFASDYVDYRAYDDALPSFRPDGPVKLGADELLSLLSETMEESDREAPPQAEPVAAAEAPEIYAMLTGKTVGVIGFSPEDSAALGQALAAQFCSFLFLTHSDAEFRKGSTNGCDLLILHAPPEWVAAGNLHPASLLKTKKPLLTFGDREVLATLATRDQGGLRELIPAPWSVADAMWRAATLLGRAHDTRGRGKRKNSRFSVIVADESPARVLVHAVLAQEGMECHVAGNGVDALNLARSKQADAVIIDVSLPGLDGFQVLAEIRRDPRLRDMVVILLTARQSEADVLRGFGLGANDYVTKPFSPMELAARVKRFLVKTR